MAKKRKKVIASKKSSSRSLPHLGKLLIFFGLLFVAVFVLLSFQSSKTKSNAQTLPQPVGQSGSWELIFTDEFDGTALNTSKWVTCYPWSGDDDGCKHSDELEWYLPANVTVSSGQARLRAKEEVVVGSDGRTYAYTSGMITTGRNKWDTTPAKFAFTYGYVEVRAKVPAGQGLWPALWLLPFSDEDPGKWPPEIDIMEILGHDTATNHMHFHYNDAAGVHHDSGDSYTGSDFSTGYHTYAMSWEPDAIRWYIDGVERRTAFTDTRYIPAEPMYFIANLAVGGDWPGAPDSTTPFPSEFLIDYVRIWQKTVPTATPTLQPSATPTPRDTMPPSVSISRPRKNKTVRRHKRMPIYAIATDASGIQKVEFYINGSRKCTDTTPSPYSCIWRVPNKKNKTYNIIAKAYDKEGNTAVSPVVKVRTKKR